MSAFDISIRDLALKKQRKRLEQERRNLIYVVCDERIDKRQATFKNTIEGVDSIAYRVHNLYGAYEELFETAANFFENQIEGARYHTDLLRRMKINIDGIRPALISEPTYRLLDELRRFHHFFRHAYGVELDADRVDRIIQIAIQLKEPFQQDMEYFLTQLKPT